MPDEPDRVITRTIGLTSLLYDFIGIEHHAEGCVTPVRISVASQASEEAPLLVSGVIPSEMAAEPNV